MNDTSSHLKLTIIGCGKVASVLAKLWQQSNRFVIQDIVNQSLKSAQAAVEFIGGGQAKAELTDLTKTDIILIGTQDEHIASVAKRLSPMMNDLGAKVVFHLSGALSSNILAPVTVADVAIASFHPIKSFANPALSWQSFAGTFCGVEGDIRAQSILSPAFEAIGAQLLPISTEQKTLYHAANVMVCNYLVALVDAALDAYQASGLSSEQAMALMRPLVAGTLENVMQLGTTDALTGPVVRGEVAMLNEQWQKLRALDANLGDIYQVLGIRALKLAKQKSSADSTKLADVERLLLPVVSGNSGIVDK